jgi:hypothetical protein
MNLFIDHYAPLFAVAAPALTLAAMNLLLALGGERGTLLLPSLESYAAARRTGNTVPAETAPAVPAVPANDPAFGQAA